MKQQLRINSLLRNFNFGVERISENSSEDTPSQEDATTQYLISILWNRRFGNVQGGGIYDKGSTVSLIATPNEHFRFIDWENGSTDSTRTFTLTKPMLLEANFDIIHCDYSIDVNDSTLGSVEINEEGEYSRQEGNLVTLTAIPEQNCDFIRWSDGDTNLVKSFNLTERTYTLTAYFERVIKYILNLIPSSEGTLTATPSYESYDENAQVTISFAQSASSGRIFEGFAVDNDVENLIEDNPFLLTMDGDKSVTVLTRLPYSCTYRLNTIYQEGTNGSRSNSGFLPIILDSDMHLVGIGNANITMNEFDDTTYYLCNLKDVIPDCYPTVRVSSATDEEDNSYLLEEEYGGLDSEHFTGGTKCGFPSLSVPLDQMSDGTTFTDYYQMTTIDALKAIRISDNINEGNGQNVTEAETFLNTNATENLKIRDGEITNMAYFFNYALLAPNWFKQHQEAQDVLFPFDKNYSNATVKENLNNEEWQTDVFIPYFDGTVVENDTSLKDEIISNLGLDTTSLTDGQIKFAIQFALQAYCSRNVSDRDWRFVLYNSNYLYVPLQSVDGFPKYNNFYCILQAVFAKIPIDNEFLYPSGKPVIEHQQLVDLANSNTVILSICQNNGEFQILQQPGVSSINDYVTLLENAGKDTTHLLDTVNAYNAQINYNSNIEEEQ